eukprot:SAG31_NODE_100_length_25264_cov_38.715359_11_plen_195_part_00
MEFLPAASSTPQVPVGAPHNCVPACPCLRYRASAWSNFTLVSSWVGPGSNGVQHRTAEASVLVAATIENSASAAASATITLDLFDSSGVVTGTVTISECQVAAAKNHSAPSLATCTSALAMSVPAKLWSPSQPILYTLRTRLSSGDEINTTIGIYKTSWKPDTGFWMNDQHVKVRGFCNHNSRSNLAAAATEQF